MAQFEAARTTAPVKLQPDATVVALAQAMTERVGRPPFGRDYQAEGQITLSSTIDGLLAGPSPVLLV